MKTVSEKLLNELEIIFMEDYGKKLERKELSKTASCLVAYFDLLKKIEFKNNKYEYRNNK